MMIKHNNIISLIFLLIFGVVFSQDSAIKKANKNFENFAYINAINQYKNIVKKGKGTIDIYQKLGNAYYFNSDLENAAKWYEKMFLKKKEIEETGDEVKNIDHECYFRMAQSLKYLKKYEDAHELISILKDSSTEDSRVKRLVETPDYLENIAIQSGRYILENLSKNSAYTDFAPSIFKDQLVFSSSRGKRRSTKKTNEWTKQPYLDLFSYSYKDSLGFSYPSEFSENLSSRLHESTSSFNSDGTVVYFTRNNLLNSEVKKDSSGVNRLKIFRAKLNNELEWSDVESLPFNDTHYSVAHPAISSNGKKLYFVSDMPGGYGASDIYVVDVSEGGDFGTPKNLGSKVNTEGRDTFPFISKTGMLYFSSDGHLGLGGLDIFVTNLEDKENKIYNIGEPVNSIADDVTFIINDDTKKGFFASNRPGGRGDDDIYSFEEISPLITKCNGIINGIITNKASNDVLVNVDVQIKDENGENIYAGKTDDKGGFSLELNCNNKEYVIMIEKENFESVTKKINVTRENPEQSQNIKLKSTLPDKGVDLVSLLKLKPIYFKSSKALILGQTAEELDKVVGYMKKYPSIRIEVGSHTDSKGSDSYNLKLSQKRATATANYIISKAIDSSRVNSRGYGETLLKNACSNGVKCSKEQHQQNRRSEFIIIEN